MPSIKNQNNLKILKEKFKAAKGMILTEYRGLNVIEVSELRSKLRQSKSEFAVVKNTISELAVKELGIEAKDLFTGPTAVVFENDDIVSPAKIVVDFAKTHDKLKIKKAFMDGKFVDAAIVSQLSSLPSREVLIAKMLGSMNAPISGFVNVLAANIRGLLNVLDAASKKQVKA
ncbi:MAG: 50S ribosomal protein L10 [Elusimicrobiota bacterium]|jgi:large subunit ribosomal protein L10|nr:50S ribosomal protein L10 [Elusimicrobiota bacterium]